VVYECRVYLRGAVRCVAVEAGSEREAALAALKTMGPGSLVLSVRPAGRKRVLSRAKLGARDLEMFCRRAQALLGAGVTAQEALEVLARESEKPALRAALARVSESVRSGFSLSAAMKARPDVFPPTLSATVAAAEEAGALPEAFRRLASHYAREAAFRDRVKQAMTYPAIVAGLAVLVTAGMFGFVVPRFAVLLAQSGVPLPGITRATLELSRKVPQILGVLLGLVLAAFVLSGLVRSSVRLSLVWERVLFRVPVLGRIALRAGAARLCRTLALMLETGIPVPRALEVAGRTAGLESFRQAASRAESVVRAGGRLAKGLESPLFPAAVLKMAAVGEASGNLSGMISEAAALMEMEVDALLGRLPPILETSMLLVVGGNVAFIMLSLFLPILSLYQSVQK